MDDKINFYTAVVAIGVPLMGLWLAEVRRPIKRFQEQSGMNPRNVDWGKASKLDRLINLLNSADNGIERDSIIADLPEDVRDVLLSNPVNRYKPGEAAKNIYENKIIRSYLTEKNN